MVLGAQNFLVKMSLVVSKLRVKDEYEDIRFQKCKYLKHLKTFHVYSSILLTFLRNSMLFFPMNDLDRENYHKQNYITNSPLYATERIYLHTGKIFHSPPPPSIIFFAILVCKFRPKTIYFLSVLFICHGLQFGIEC